MAKSFFDYRGARLLASVFAAALLTACPPPIDPGQPAGNGTMTGPSVAPLNQTPLKVTLNSTIGNYQGISVVMVDSARKTIGSVLIPQTCTQSRPLADIFCTGSASIGPVTFSYSGIKYAGKKQGVSEEGGQGTVSFKLDAADYAQLTPITGHRLASLQVHSSKCGLKTCYDEMVAIERFGEGFMGLSKPYYYAFAAGTPNAETVRIDYVADVNRVANLTKSWSIGRNGTPLISFTEKCSEYGDYQDKASTCTTDYAGKSAYSVSTNRDLQPGIYDVIVSVRDDVEKKNLGEFSSKLTVANHPVASLSSANASSTLVVGTRLQFDAAASVADVGAIIEYRLTKPAASQARLLDEGTRNPSVVTDVPGVYELTLSVSFNGETSTSSVSRTVVHITGASGG
ncbi:MAG TPA: hypothetical protein VIL30_27080 [Ramlibacter sp.]|jgi:hypothetical protein